MTETLFVVGYEYRRSTDMFKCLWIKDISSVSKYCLKISALKLNLNVALEVVQYRYGQGHVDFYWPG